MENYENLSWYSFCKAIYPRQAWRGELLAYPATQGFLKTTPATIFTIQNKKSC